MTDELKNRSGIYKITCTPTNKFYIGSAVNLYKRYKEHFNDLKNQRHGNEYLQRAYLKYGEDAFVFSVIEYCSPNVLLLREQFFLDTLNATTRSIGYNIAPTAGNMQGLRHSQETKEKIRKALTGYKQSEENKLRKSIAGKERRHSEEAKAKIGAKHRGKTLSQETRDKISEKNRGRVMSAVSREKMSLSHKGYTPSQETRNKMSTLFTGSNNPNSRRVYCLDRDTREILALYLTMKDAALDLGRHPSGISDCCRGKTKTAYGYVWCYADEYQP